ncbi:MAG TPA: glycoside hydrolase family 18 protein [Gemmataceae bacterium]|jgi:GH18 family chitinase|nr:glycoside hydrolase family 18 protein [Gemmataceae bacterium]
MTQSDAPARASAALPRVLAVTATSLLFFAVPPTASSGGKDADASKQPGTFAIVAYVPDYRVEGIDASAGPMVTDLIFFSIEPEPSGALNTGRLRTTDLKKLAGLRRRHKNRLLIAVGGWERSRGFAAVATHEKARSRFVRDLTRLCLENKFDGADLDWEHPANKAEEDAYASLLVELRRAFRPKRLLLTVTLATWQNPGPKAYGAVDRVHVMAYDHQGARHSTFAQAEADVKAFVTRGAPRKKICLGVPFYGRGMKDRGVVMSYAEIVRKHKPSPEEDEAGGVYFNGINTIRRKARYAKENGLGGVMIWELGQDTADETSLLRAIKRAVPK